MGQANKSLLGVKTLFNNSLFNWLPSNFSTIVVGLIITIVVVASVAWFLQTELGQAFIATGDNQNMARAMGIDSDAMITLGLIISNALIALGGALVAQNNGFADVNMGIGIIVVALASIIIGEVVYTDQLTLMERLVTVVIGSILYRFVLVAVLALGFDANDLNLFSAIILGLALLLPKLRQSLHLATLFNMKGSKE